MVYKTESFFILLKVTVMAMSIIHGFTSIKGAFTDKNLDPSREKNFLLCRYAFDNIFVMLKTSQIAVEVLYTFKYDIRFFHNYLRLFICF